MKQRDLWKQRAKDLAIISPVACPAQVDAWNQYKLFRNQVNNRRKYEEQDFKSAKMTEVADSPDLVWKSAKSVMGWKTQGTPNQIKVDGQLVTSAKKIAQAMNEFFLNKVQTIREGMTSVAFNLSKVHDIMLNKKCKMKLKHASLQTVKKVLKSLSNSRSTGIDELDNFLVNLLQSLLPNQFIICIITLSIIKSKFPQKFSPFIRSLIALKGRTIGQLLFFLLYPKS